MLPRRDAAHAAVPVVLGQPQPSAANRPETEGLCGQLVLRLATLTTAAGWCASRSAAILYGKEAGFGADSGPGAPIVTLRLGYGALTWRAM
jgi:hypothetical protein